MKRPQLGSVPPVRPQRSRIDVYKYILNDERKKRRGEERREERNSMDREIKNETQHPLSTCLLQMAICSQLLEAEQSRDCCCCFIRPNDPTWTSDLQHEALPRRPLRVFISRLWGVCVCVCVWERVPPLYTIDLITSISQLSSVMRPSKCRKRARVCGLMDGLAL